MKELNDLSVTQETVVDENSTDEKKRRRTHGALHRKMHGFAQLFDSLLQVEEVKGIAASLKFTEANIQEGVVLLKEAQSLMEEQQVAQGRMRSLSEAVQALRTELNLDYMKHLKLVKLVFKGRKGLLETLRANGVRKRNFDSWLFDLQVFYRSTLENEEVKKMLADNDVNDKILKAQLKKVEEIAALHHDKVQEQAEAVRKTHQRNEAIKKVEQWVSFFRQKARAEYFYDHEKRLLLGL